MDKQFGIPVGVGGRQIASGDEGKYFSGFGDRRIAIVVSNKGKTPVSRDGTRWQEFGICNVPLASSIGRSAPCQVHSETIGKFVNPDLLVPSALPPPVATPSTKPVCALELNTIR